MNNDFMILNIPEILTDDIRNLLTKRRDDIASSIEEREQSLLPDKEKLNWLNRIIESFSEKAPEIVNNREEYSYKWRTPLKTIFILKNMIKRPASASEVIAAIELKDNGMGEIKKTTVFSTLANQAESGQLVKSKPGAENLYCHPDHVEKENMGLKKQLDLMT
jgi:hypothetical protein